MVSPCRFVPPPTSFFSPSTVYTEIDDYIYIQMEARVVGNRGRYLCRDTCEFINIA